MPLKALKRMPGGRPPKFKTPEELETLIQEYFDNCTKDKDFPTKGGLALHLDTTRDVLGDYEKKEGFSNAIKRAYEIIEDTWVQTLGKKQSVAGPIFYLKNAFSKTWRDKQETDITSGGEPLQPVLVKFLNGKEPDHN